MERFVTESFAFIRKSDQCHLWHANEHQHGNWEMTLDDRWPAPLWLFFLGLFGRCVLWKFAQVWNCLSYSHRRERQPWLSSVHVPAGCTICHALSPLLWDISLAVNVYNAVSVKDTDFWPEGICLISQGWPCSAAFQHGYLTESFKEMPLGNHFHETVR